MKSEEMNQILSLEEDDVEVYNIIRFRSIDAVTQYHEFEELIREGEIYTNDEGLDLVVFNNKQFLKFLHLLTLKGLIIPLDILRINKSYWELTFYKNNRPIQQSSKSYNLLKGILDSKDVFVRLNFGAIQSLAHDKYDIDELSTITKFIKIIVGNNNSIELSDLVVQFLAYVTLLYNKEPEDVMNILENWNNYEAFDENLPVVPLLNINDYEDYYYEYSDKTPAELKNKVEFFEQLNNLLKGYKELLLNTLASKMIYVLIDTVDQETLEKSKRKYNNYVHSLSFQVRLVEGKINNSNTRKVFLCWTSRGRELDLERYREIKTLIPNSVIEVRGE